MPDREHWLSRVQPLGSSRLQIEYSRAFSPAEAEKLRNGVWPQNQDERWVILLGDTSLDLWRSWTGHCIFSLPALTSDSGVMVQPLIVNGDAEQYRRVSDAEDIRLLESIINRILKT